MQDTPLFRRDAEAYAEAYFEERAAYAIPEAAAVLTSNRLSDRTTTKLGRRFAKSTSSGASKSGSIMTKKPDRVGQVINNAAPVLNGIGSIVQGMNGLFRREATMEEMAMPLVQQRSAKSTSSNTSKSAPKSVSTKTKKPDRVGQVINNAAPVLNGIGSIVQGLDGLFRREATIDGLVRRDLTMQEAAMLHARSLRAHRRSAKTTSNKSSGSTKPTTGSSSGGVKPQSSVSKPKPNTSSSGSSSHPDRFGQVVNNAGPVLNGIGSIVQGVDGLLRRDVTMEEIVLLEARDLEPAANRRRSFSHIQTNQLQNKVIESNSGSLTKREAEPNQQRRPKHIKRSASVGSYLQQLERDVGNIVGTVVARDAEAEPAREDTIQPNSTTTTVTSASGNSVVNTLSISENAKNGTSAVETDSKKKTTKEEETGRKHSKESKAKEAEKEQAKKGREHRIKEQKHRERLREEKIAKEKAEIKKLGKTIKGMNSTVAGTKEALKQNSTADIVSSKKADLNAKPVPSIPAQVAKVAARAAEIVRSWTGLHE
ncbi:hypothetical protein MMC11_000513 [Xylographa trunciseda]|nr:hypothetical protein [Xylographa trunciseda]